jgi:hypothetical protein
MRVGFSMKRFRSGSTIHHAHESQHPRTSEQQSDNFCRGKNKVLVVEIVEFPRGDDTQERRG